MSKLHSLSDAEAERQPSASVRVLIVDDNEPWRRWVCSELGRQQQLRVVGEALDGLEAVRKAHELKPDIILLDIGLPNLNGLEAANRIAQSLPDSKIVFLTAQNDPDLVKQASSNGATGYILKVHAQAELLAAIAAVVQGRRFLGKGLATPVWVGESRRSTRVPLKVVISAQGITEPRTCDGETVVVYLAANQTPPVVPAVPATVTSTAAVVPLDPLPPPPRPDLLPKL